MIAADGVLATASAAGAGVVLALSGAVTDTGAAAGAGIAVVTFTGLVWRGGRRVFASLVDHLDERIEQRTAPLVEDLAAVRAQLVPDHGHSARDSLDRIEVQIGNVETRVVEQLVDLEERLGDRVAKVEAHVHLHQPPMSGDTTP